MIARFLLVLALCLATGRSDAWLIFAPGGYVGPGDIVSFTAWYGMRGYSRAYALPGSNPAMTLRRNDGAECTVTVGSDGNLDTGSRLSCNSGTQTVVDWAAAGATHTCTGSISGTTFTAKAATTCNIVPGDLLTGVGVAANTYMTERGSCVAGQPFSGTCQVYPSQTVAADTVFTGTPYGMAPLRWYDQTGNNACGGSSCDLSSNGGTDWPLMFLTGCGSFPCLSIPSSSMKLISTNSFTPTSTGAGGFMAMATVAQRYVVVGNGVMTFMDPSETSTVGLKADSAAATWSIGGAGGGAACAATDGAWHAAVGVIGGPGSVCNLDGSETAGAAATPVTLSGRPAIVDTHDGILWMREVGFKDGGNWSSATRGALCHNMRRFYGVAGTC
jgi:hypothetical protein